MKRARHRINRAVTALGLGLLVAVPVAVMAIAPATAQQSPEAVDLDALLAQLANPDEPGWRRIERRILQEWGRSGSAAVDFLFQRGQAALQEGDAVAAVAHFSAAIDHDPDFTEAWHARASAYFMANRLGPAMADLEVVLAREPRHFGALTGLGTILELTDRPEAARAAFAAAVAVHPHRPRAREALERLELALAGRAL